MNRLPLFVSCGVIAASLAAASACGPGKADGTPLSELAGVTDDNAAPDVIEFQLEARVAQTTYLTGKLTEVWTYNGTVPGPLIEAKVGDELIVHFKNSLPQETTIHWHGLRLPAAMDGTLAMQAPIPPGGTFEYRFKLLDAGLFWFHPHVRANEQVESGLFGTILVRDSREPQDLGRERVVVLDDVYLNADGSLVAADKLGLAAKMIGREGNVLLANGASEPVLDVRSGERLRLRLVNVGNARYFKLAIPGQQLTLVGVDGGLLEAPRVVDSLLLTPGERADVLIDVDGARGSMLELMTLPYERGHETGDGEPERILRLRVTGEKGERDDLPANLRALEPLRPANSARTLTLTEEEVPNGDPIFKINGEAFPEITPLEASIGTVEEWSVVNDTEMDHPFHLHGFFFEVLDLDGSPPLFRAVKDTVNVPAKSTLRFNVAFDAHPGSWMFHCHILEHAELGMMGEVTVNP